MADGVGSSKTSTGVREGATPFTLGSFVDMGVNGHEMTRALAKMKTYLNRVEHMDCRVCQRTMFAVVTNPGSGHPSRLLGPIVDYGVCDECHDAAQMGVAG